MQVLRIRRSVLLVLLVVVAGVAAAGAAAALSHHATSRSVVGVVPTHAGSLDTGSGSAARQGYTTNGPAKPGDSGSLNEPAPGALTPSQLALIRVAAHTDDSALVHSALTFGLTAKHAGSLDTGSGSAARQGYTTSGPAKAGDSGSLNVSAVTAKQRIELQEKAAGVLAVIPLTSGAIKPDTGGDSICCWTQRFITRNGQSIEIDNPEVTFISNRGTMVIRQLIDWLDLPDGYAISTGTWRVVRGTGAYAGLSGGGGHAGIQLRDGSFKWQDEGLLDSK